MDDRIADAPRVDASARRRVGTSARGGGGMASPWRAEARAHVALALPVTLASLCNRARDLISLGFVGAASATDGLAGAALASTIANVTGNAVVVGLTSALLTLAGQAYGDGRGGEAWAWAQRALACCAATATATAIGWRFVEDALLAWNFDAAIARSCAAYLRGLRPGLFAYAANACAQAWLQAQGCARPIACAGVAATVLHAPTCACFRRMGFGAVGPAYATSVSTSLVFAANATYARLRRNRNGWFRERDEALAERRDACASRVCFKTMFDREGLVLFLKLGVPGVLLMSEWWASEFIVLAAGKLRNPSVAISAMSIYQATNAFAFMVAVGFGAATATRVSNEVGAKDASRAKLAASVALRLIVVVEVAVSATVYLSRERWGAAFTSDHDVRALVSKLMVPLAFYVFFDAVCCVSTSVLRGAGRQAFATPIVLFAYYVVGLPLSAWLAYTGYGAVGLAIGGVVGTATHAGIMTRVALCIDWPTEIARSKHIRGASAVDDDADDLASRLLVDVAADDDDGNAVDALI